MKNKMSSTAKNDVIDLAPHLPSPRVARPPRRSEGAVIPFRTTLPERAPMEAPTRSGIPPAARRGVGRALNFLKRLLARIDVTNFPGSCCG